MNNGYFDDARKEFVITDLKPRRLWYNYLWNEETVCVCDQFGGGNVWADYDGLRRTIESGDRNVYIKDKSTGEFYSANRNYNDLPFDKHETHVGLGYQRIVSTYKGVKTEFTLLVPLKGKVMLYEVRVKNESSEKKDLSVYFTVQPNTNLSPHSAYGSGEYDKKLFGFVFRHEGFAIKNPYSKVYVGCDSICNAYDTDANRFKGIYNGFHDPVALKNDKLASTGFDFSGQYIAAFQFDETLSSGDEKVYKFCAAALKAGDDAAKLKSEYLSPEVFSRELERQKSENDKYSNVFELKSPDDYLNSQVNIWLKRQLSLGKTWGRVYGKGFRDVMQDITAFVSFDAELAKKRILHALSYQYEDGNPIRMFEPNFRYPYNDGGAWITGAVLSYLNESGDKDILNETVSYLKGDSYENAKYVDAFFDEPYEAGNRKDSVLCHVKSAVDYLLSCRGKHNLVLWRGGDWNDSLNNAGIKNIGESVWLSIATVKAINELREILRIAGETEETITDYERKKDELKKAIRENGFKSGKYIYGINDYGEDVGGAERTFLNPQTWAVLADADDKAILNKVMDVVEKELKCDYGYVQCRPSFTKGDDKIGRISYFKSGLVENGAVYNHGVAFKIVADCILGRGDAAYASLKAISCDNEKNKNSGVEPYAVSNMYIGPENRFSAGYAPMSWITGTAGWLYRCISEYICGVKATVNGLTVKPCFPSEWNGIKAKRKFRNEIYEITYIKSGERKLVCDGKEVKILPLCGEGSKHEVICYY